MSKRSTFVILFLWQLLLQWATAEDNAQSLRLTMPPTYRDFDYYGFEKYSEYSVSMFFYAYSGWSATYPQLAQISQHFQVHYLNYGGPVQIPKLRGVTVSPKPSSPINVEEWNLIVFTYDLTTVKLYTNFNSPSTETHSGKPTLYDTWPKLQIGPGSGTQTSWIRYFAIFDKSISSQTVSTLNYQPNGINQKTSNLILYFKFFYSQTYQNEVLTPNFYLTNTEKHPSYTLYQATETIPAYEVPKDSAPGPGSKSLILNADQQINVPMTNAMHNMQSFTWEIWINQKAKPIHTVSRQLYILQFKTSTGYYTSLRRFYRPSNLSCEFIYTNIRATTQPRHVYDRNLFHQSWKHYSMSFTHTGKTQWVKSEQAVIYSTASVNPSTLYTITSILVGKQANQFPAQAGKLALREFRFWNCYRTIGDIQIFKSNHYIGVNHPNLISYLTLSNEQAEGQVQTNYAHMHGFQAAGYTLLNKDFQFDSISPLICPPDQYRDFDNPGKCTSSKHYAHSLKTAQESFDTFKWVIPSLNSYVVEHWVYISTNFPASTTIMGSQVTLTQLNTDANKVLRCYNGPKANQAAYTRFGTALGKWFHVTISGSGKKDVIIYVNSIQCNRNGSHYSTDGEIRIYITPTSLPTSSKIRLRYIKRWSNQKYTWLAQSMMNSTILDPYEIPQLLEYYQLSAKFGDNQLYIDGKRSTNNFLVTIFNTWQRTVKEDSMQGPINKFCHHGSFLGPYPNFDKCYMPRPVLRPKRGLGNHATTEAKNPMIAQIDTSSMDNTHVTIAIWFSIDSGTPNQNYDLICAENQNDLRLTLHYSFQSNQKSFYTIQNEQKGYTISNTDLKNREWILGMYQLRQNKYMVTSFKSLNLQVTNEVVIQRTNLATGYSTPILKIFAGATTHKQHHAHHPYFRVRNFFYIDKAPHFSQVRATLMSENQIYSAGRNPNLHFSTISHSSTLQIDDYRHQPMGMVEPTTHEWTVDQVFPYRVCDDRFGGSDYRTTCGAYQHLYIVDEHYTEQINGGGSRFHSVHSGGNTITTSQAYTVKVWMRMDYQVQNKSVLMFGVGSLRQNTYDVQNLFFGLTMYNDYQHAVKDHYQFKLHIVKHNVMNHKQQFGSNRAKSLYYGLWKHFTLVRANKTHYQMYENGALFGQVSNTTFPNGQFHFSFQIGSQLNQQAVGNSIRARYRDFALYDGIQITTGKELYEGYGYLDYNLLYYEPFNYIASRKYHFMQYQLTMGESEPLLDRYTYSTNPGALSRVIHYVYVGGKNYANLGPYYTDFNDNANKNPYNLVFLPHQSSPVGTFTNKHTAKTSYTISTYFLAASNANKHLLFSIENMGEVNVDQSSNHTLELNIKPSHVVSMSSSRVYNVNMWNSLVLCVDATNVGKRNMWVNQNKVLSSYLSSITSLPAITHPIDEQRKVYFGQISYQNNFGIWNENWSDEPGYEPGRYFQLIHNRLEGAYSSYNPENKLLLFNVLLERINLQFTSGKHIQYSCYNYNKKEYPVDTGLTYYTMKTITTNYDMYYCDHLNQYFDGLVCRNNTVLGMISHPNALNKVKAYGLTLEIGDKLVNQPEYVLEFWYISQYDQIASNSINFFYHWRQLKSTPVGTMLKLMIPKTLQYIHGANTFNVTDSDTLNQPTWTHLFLKFKTTNLLQVFIDEVKQPELTITSVQDWKDMETNIQLCPGSQRNIAIQHLRTWSNTFTYRSKNEAHNDRKMLYLTSYWPLTQVKDNTDIIYEVINKFQKTVGELKWVDPFLIVGRQVEALVMCQGGFKYSQTSRRCMKDVYNNYEYFASATPHEHPIKLTNSGAIEWSLTFWHRTTYHKQSQLPLWVVKTDWTSKGFLGLRHEHTTKYITSTNLDGGKYDYDESNGQRLYWSHYGIIKHINPDKLYVYLNYYQFDITTAHYSRVGTLPKEMKLYFSVINTGEDREVTVGIKEFVIWSEALIFQDMIHKSQTSIPMSAPNLDVYIKYDNDEMLNMGNPASGVASVRTFLDTIDQTQISDLFQSYYMRGQCGYNRHVKRGYRYCIDTPQYNMFSTYSAQGSVDADITAHVEDYIKAGERSFTFFFFIRCLGIQNVTKNVFRYDQLFTMYHEPNNEFKFRLHRKGQTDLMHTVPGLLSCGGGASAPSVGQYEKFIVHYNLELSQVRFMFKQNPSKNFSFTNIKPSDLNIPTTHTIRFGDTGVQAKYQFSNFYIFFPNLNNNEIDNFIINRATTMLNGQAGLVQGLYYEYPYTQGSYVNARSIMTDDRSIQHPTGQKDYGYYGFHRCPVGTIRMKYSTSCQPLGALVVGKFGRLYLNRDTMIIRKEVSVVVWYKGISLKGTIHVVLLDDINALSVAHVTGGNDYLTTYYTDCSAAWSQGKQGFDADMKQGTPWMQLAVVQYISKATVPYKQYISLYKDAQRDLGYQPILAKCQDYQNVTVGQLSIDPRSTESSFAVTRIMVLTDALSQGELKYLQYSDIDTKAYYKSLVVYYKLYNRQLTERDYASDSQQTTFTQPTTNLDVSFLRFIDGPGVPIGSYAAHKGMYFRKDKHLYFPKHQSLTKRIQVNVAQFSLQNAFTATYCAYILDEAVGFTGYILDGGDQVSVYHQLTTTGSGIGFNSDSLIQSKYEDGTNEVKKLIWFCGAVGAITTTPPAYLKSEFYVMNDQTGMIRAKKTVVTEGSQYVKSPMTQSIDKFYIGSHAQGSYLQCNCILAEVKFFNTYLHTQKAYLYISRHHVSLHDFPSMKLYMKLDEAGLHTVYNLADASEHTFDQGAAPSQPYWMTTPKKLTICHHDQRFVKYDYDSEGFCNPYIKILRPKSNFNFKVEDSGFEATLGFWLQTIARSSHLYVKFGDRINFKFTTTNNLYFQYENGDVVFGPQGITNFFGTSKWNHITVKYSKELQRICFDGVSSSNQMHTKNNALLNFQTLTPTVLDVKVLDGIQTDEIYLVDVRHYNAYLHSATTRFRRSIHQFSEKHPSMIAYYHLTEGAPLQAVNRAAYAPKFYHAETTDAEWTYFKAGLNGYNQWHYCFRENYYPKVDANPNDCVRLPQDCSQCTDAKNVDQCKGDPTVPANCLQQPANTGYTPDIIEYQDCHNLCTTCNTPIFNKDCTSCVTPYRIKAPMNSCETFCDEGKAFNMSDAPHPLCYTCTKTNCTCDDDQFDHCTGCVSASGSYYIKNGPPDGQTPYCDNTCGTGKYYEPRMLQCEDCFKTCKDCTGRSGSECTSCADPLNFKLEKGECQQVVCGKTEYRVQLDCFPCNAKCHECYGPLDTNCKSCAGSTTILFKSNNSCIDCVLNHSPNLILPTGAALCVQKCNGAGKVLDSLPYVDNPPGFCSDGNLVDHDGCSQDCRVEFGFICSGGNLTHPDKCIDVLAPTVMLKDVVKSPTSVAIYLQFSEKMNITENRKLENLVDLNAYIQGPNYPYLYTWKCSIRVALLDQDNLLKVLLYPLSSTLLSETFNIKFLKQNDFKDLAGNALSNNLVIAPMPKFEFIKASEEQQTSSGGQAALYASLITIGVNVVTNVLVGGAMHKMWDFINSIQIIYFMPLIDIGFPTQLKKVLKYFEFALADIELPIPNVILIYIIPSKDLIDTPLNENFNEFGINSQLLLKLYSTKLVFWFALFSIYPIVLTLILIFRFCKQNKVIKLILKLLRQIEGSFRYNSLIRILMELYLEITLFSYINLYNLQYNNLSQFAASVTAISALAGVTMVPILFSHIVSKNHKIVEQTKFKAQYGAITEGIKFKIGRMILLHWASIFLYRRLMYVIILVFLYPWPQFQMLCCIAKNTVLIIVLVLLRPFSSRSQFCMYLLNEGFIWGTFFISCGFIKSLGLFNDRQKKIITYTILGGIVFFVSVNLFMIMVEIMFQIVLGVRNVIRKCQGKGVAPKQEEVKVDTVPIGAMMTQGPIQSQRPAKGMKEKGKGKGKGKSKRGKQSGSRQQTSVSLNTTSMTQMTDNSMMGATLANQSLLSNQGGDIPLKKVEFTKSKLILPLKQTKFQLPKQSNKLPSKNISQVTPPKLDLPIKQLQPPRNERPPPQHEYVITYQLDPSMPKGLKAAQQLKYMKPKKVRRVKRPQIRKQPQKPMGNPRPVQEPKQGTVPQQKPQNNEVDDDVFEESENEFFDFDDMDANDFQINTNPISKFQNL